MIKTFPRLYGLATNGKIKTILFSVEALSDGTCDIVNEHGYLDGKKQYDHTIVQSGKNIGKANETTIQEQAIFDAQSKWNAKKDQNYTENSNGVVSAYEKSLLPMLAKKFKDMKHKIDYPCYVQPKLDGLRGVATISKNGVRISSRKDKPYDAVKHLYEQIKNVFGHIKVPIDGEIYLYGLTIEDVNRRVKSYKGEITEEMQFWVFDIVDESKTNAERNEVLYKAKQNAINKGIDMSHIVFVPTYEATCEQDIYEYHDKFVKDGYEGVIIRNKDAKYLCEKRSSDLQKYKQFEDDEFEIVGITAATTGRESGAIIFVCKIKNPTSSDNTTFDVRPRGNIKNRIEEYKKAQKNPKNYIGKKYTVRYFRLLESNAPEFPTGIIIREDI
jgi:ATP-dependent DNA ligase